MSDEQQQQAVTKPAVPSKKTSGFQIFWTVLFLILFGVMGILGYTKWLQLQQQLHALKESIQQDSKLNDTRFQPLQDKINQVEIQQNTLKTDVAQQNETLSAWKEAASGNINRWYVAEARYLVKLAQYEANASSNYLLVSAYLEKANDVLQKVSDPKAVDMRNALKQDQEQVTKAESQDIGALYQKLVALDKQIDFLPVPLQTTPSIPKPSVPDVNLMNKGWWNKGLDETWQLLKQMVVVKKYTDTRLPFLLPDERSLLAANMHLQMQHAMDGLLRNQAKIYQASLQQTIDWVQRYCKTNEALTIAWLKDMAQLQQVNFNALSLDISHAVPLFDAYLG